MHDKDLSTRVRQNDFYPLFLHKALNASWNKNFIDKRNQGNFPQLEIETLDHIIPFRVQILKASDRGNPLDLVIQIILKK